MFGGSGVGKSTRLYRLFKFLREQETPFTLFINGHPVGYRFEQLKVAIVGKEYWSKKLGHKAFQGLDAFIKKLGNFQQQYDALYRCCEQTEGDLIVESVMTLSTHRTGPKYILENSFDVAYESELFFYETFDEFRQRVAARGGRKYEREEDAPIWLKNQQYLRKYEVFQNEITDPQRFRLSKYPHTDPVDNFSRRFLMSSGREHLINDFERFVVQTPFLPFEPNKMEALF
jgi:hypothetical protein